MERQKRKKIRNRALLSLGILAVLLAAALFMLRFFGEKEMLDKKGGAIKVSAPETEEILLEDEGNFVTYRGERYRYNDNITAVLCMGIDKQKLDGESVIGTSGQADMLMLAILDTKSGDVDLWNISRDAITDVDIYNVDGEYVRTDQTQLCLAYAYGDGRERSCENTVKSVSRLLYGMPVQSYAAIDLEAIGALNDAVGGVEVTIHEEDILPPEFKPGTTIVLDAKAAETYVRTRGEGTDREALDSNNNRMERQRRYMTGFIDKAVQMTKKDLTVPLTLFQTAMDNRYMVTDLNAAKVVYLTTVFSKVKISEDSFFTVPGEVREKDGHAAFYVDDEALYEKILETFYMKQEKTDNND